MIEVLTEKQKIWADEYLIDKNKTRAALVAGYSKSNARKQGHMNANNANIQAYIAKRMGSQKEKEESQKSQEETNRIADGNEVMEFFSDVMRGNITGTHIGKDGNVFETAPSLKDRLAAGKELAQRYGLNKQVIEIGNADDKAFKTESKIDFSDFTPEQKIAFARAAFGKERTEDE